MNNKMQKDGIRILVADNFQIISDGIIAILQEESHLEIVGKAHSAEKILDLCSRHEVDLLIVNLEILHSLKTNLLKVLHDDYRNIKIMVLAYGFGRKDLKRIVEAGVDGYILKKSGKQVLLEAIDVIASGQKYFDSKITKKVIQNYIGADPAQNGRDDPHALTQRELEVLTLICQEYTNQEIAEKLHISVRTVDTHRRNLLQKTGARNTAGLVRYAMKHDLE